MPRYLLLFSLLLSVVSTLVHAHTPAQFNPKGAVCVIRDTNGQVVLVQDYLTRTLSLPGGYIDNNETFQAAAKRETKEETGLIVNVGKQLAIDNNRVVFACQPKEAVGYIDPAINNNFNAHIIPALNSLHFGREIRQVYLAALTDKVLRKYRYPSDTATLAAWVTASQTTEFFPIQHNLKHADEQHREEIVLMEKFQSWAKSNSLVGSFLNITNWLGEGATVIGLLVLCLLIFPLRYGLVIAFALLATTYSVSLLKLGFAIPRPFYILPSLQQAQASNFSFPSGHTTQAAAIIGLLLGLITSRHKQPNRLSLPAALVSWFTLSLLAGTARVWLGVHYPSDVIAGITLGGAIALLSLAVFNITYTKKKQHTTVISKRLIESKRMWALLLVIYFYATTKVLQPMYVFTWFAALGIFIAMFFTPTSASNQTRSSNVSKTASSWQQILIAILGMAVIGITPSFFINSATTSIIQLVVSALVILFGMLWLLIATPRLGQRFR